MLAVYTTRLLPFSIVNVSLGEFTLGGQVHIQSKSLKTTSAYFLQAHSSGKKPAERNVDEAIDLHPYTGRHRRHSLAWGQISWPAWIPYAPARMLTHFDRKNYATFPRRDGDPLPHDVSAVRLNGHLSTCLAIGASSSGFWPGLPARLLVWGFLGFF